MQYYCSQCRRPLQTAQTMCPCGQIFDRVPPYDPNTLSNYWPQASMSAGSRFWDNIPNTAKMITGGVSVLAAVVGTVGGSIHQYSALHARYAPGRPVMAASAAPVRVQAPPAAMAPSALAPLVLQAAPRYVPPKGNEIASNIPRPVNQQSLASDAPPPVIMAPNVAASQVTPAQYASALSDAEKAVYDARDYVNNLTPQDFQRAPISLQPFLSRVKQDRSTMLGSPTVSPRDMAEVNADQRGIQDMEDTCNSNRGAASTNMG